MAIQSIDLHCTGDLAGVFCPVCGEAVYKQGEDPVKCGHVLFTHIDAIGDFDYVAPSMEGIVAEARERAQKEDQTPVEFVLNQLKSGSVLCWSVTTEGFACGPASITIWIAVDFDVE